MTTSPDVVWMFDDDPDAINLVRDELDRHHTGSMTLRADTDPEEVLKWFDDLPFVCDCLVADIVVEEKGELELMNETLGGSLPLETLCELSGVGLLARLRHEWPRLPVVMLSAYFSAAQTGLVEVLRSLTRSALCGLAKTSSHILPRLLWIAQQAIAGVRVPERLVEGTRSVLQEVNKSQNHFHFVLCNSTKSLAVPRESILQGVQEPRDHLPLYETWNNRVLALLSDTEVEAAEAFHPFLPFSGTTFQQLPINLDAHVRNMGKAYLAPYLIRECARAAYRMFFDIKPHPVDTGQCLFDSSTHAPDLLDGIERGKICPACELQMTPPHAHGGWSEGRGKAAARIAELAKEALLAVE